MESVVASDLRVERRGQQRALLHGDDAAVVETSENVDIGAHTLDHGRTNEHGMHRRPAQRRNVKVGLEGFKLRAEGVSAHNDIEPSQGLLPHDRPRDRVSEHDETGAGAVDGHPRGDASPQRLLQIEQSYELVHHARLAAGDDKTINARQIRGATHLDDLDLQSAEHAEVLAHIALQGEDAHGRCGATSHARTGGEVQEGRKR